MVAYMSLDVYLTMPGQFTQPESSGIFIRESGQTKEISREEWERKNPGIEPVIFQQEESEKVYSANITHNLNKMAKEAGIYKALWRPDECGIEKAKQLIPLLTEGYNALMQDPGKFEAFNPTNGWGTYEGLCGFVLRYLEACKKYPDAIVSVCR